MLQEPLEAAVQGGLAAQLAGAFRWHVACAQVQVFVKVRASNCKFEPQARCIRVISTLLHASIWCIPRSDKHSNPCTRLPRCRGG